jgi:predicted glycoside hydrolase/deacetylase ChbG (UPF0249 family)
LLIVHADDLALSHSVNRATFEALRSGSINSASIMVPCPWLTEVAEFAKTHPDMDLGIHLTLNAEWEWLKWGPVASRDRVSSLLDPRGFMLPSVRETVAVAKPDEVETEVRAQIERAGQLGIRPTHLDSHMGTLFSSPQMLSILFKLGREMKLPVLAPRRLLGMAPYAKELILPSDALIDDLRMMSPGVPESDWPKAYNQMIEGLQPGVTQLIVHVGYDDEEMQGVARNHPDYGSRWRKLDLDYVNSQEFRDVLRRNRIQLVTWREIGRVLG